MATAIDVSGVLDRIERTNTYTPRTVGNLVYGLELWWWQLLGEYFDRLIEAVVREYERRPRQVDLNEQKIEEHFEKLSETAMRTLLLVGAWSSSVEGTTRRRTQREYGSPFAVLGVETSAERWIRENEVKFPRKFEQTFGIPTASLERYSAKHIPNIKRLGEAGRILINHEVVQAVRNGWDPDQLQAVLRKQESTWHNGRCYNVVRTESSHLFNGGRAMNQAQDPLVIGYEYLVTLDDRTTEVCEAFEGVKVRADQVRDVPPFHYQCRTVMVPLYPWDEPEFTSEGWFPYLEGTEWDGWGQPDLAETLVRASRTHGTLEKYLIEKGAPAPELKQLTAKEYAKASPKELEKRGLEVGDVPRHEWVTSITPEEQDALDYWLSGGGCDNLRAIDKTGDLTLDGGDRYEHFKNLLDKAKPVQSDTLYRGFAVSEDVREEILSAKTIVLDSHQSSSQNRTVGASFAYDSEFMPESGTAKPMMFEIQNNKTAVDVSGLGEEVSFHDEEEAILRKGAVYEVVGLKTLDPAGIPGYGYEERKLTVLILQETTKVLR